jgi:hypothetical protein
MRAELLPLLRGHRQGQVWILHERVRRNRVEGPQGQAGGKGLR